MDSQIFMQVPGIHGESMQWMQLITVSFGVNVPISANGVGKSQLDTVIVVKTIDSTSFVLYEYALRGKACDGTTIDIVGSEPGTTSRVVLKQCLLTRITSEAESAAASGRETLEFSCSQIVLSTTSMDATGNAVVIFQTGWDTTANKPI